MSPADRGAWLAGLEATHPGAVPLLRKLIESHERGERGAELETLPRFAPLPDWSSDHVAGLRIGPFELVRPLGRGGMGEVWLARQVDGRVQREVALKLPGVLQHGNVWRERFSRERDILARLEHPHIARFYDAGVTESGQPWLAMECVFGTTLLDHAAARALTIPQRLALFRQILSAVAHAHRHLVVHRDLKPGNVLVDEDGVVKLLDFGIAKLVEEGADDTAGDLTRLGGHMMTLRYAAPEQVAAGSITTSTDIYALGVILHELVTGLSPYAAVRDGKPFRDAMLLEGQSTLPSRLLPGPLARVVAGDLDAIVLKAMRRDPSERYASVELFDADVAAHLQQRPVRARAGTWRYLAGRFAVRNKLPLALAATVLVSLVAGLVVAERERRVAVAEKARAERERQVAVVEKARAERHFASVRKLANTFIFDVHGKIENLPGSLAAREMLIATSLEYLDSLAREPGRDPALLLEVASAYRSIGNVQGAPRDANRGNLAASIANFEKAAAMLDELERLKPGEVAAVREHWRTSLDLGEAYFQVTDPRWRAELQRAIGLADRIASTPGAGADDRSVAAFTRGREAHLVAISTGRTPEIIATLTGAITVLEGLRPQAPPKAALHERLAGLYRSAGVVLAGPGEGQPRMREAIAYLERAMAMARELATTAPQDTRRRNFERVTTLILARHLAAYGDLRRADALLAEATARIDPLVARAPDDVTLAVNRLEILVGAADAANRLGELPRAMRLCREVLASAAGLPKEAWRLRDVRMQATEAKVILGYALVASAEAGEGDREGRLAMLVEARSLFADVNRFLEDVRAEPSLGAVPEYKLREFAQAQARLDRAFRKMSET
jgi:tRNA A-37 threonylcarbamoyl transferase component Bud32/tetratricopeptide (TPR) repeat protein